MGTKNTNAGIRNSINMLESISHAAAVTPSDTVDLSYTTRQIYIGGAGDLKVTLVGGETVTYTGIAAGHYAKQVTRVWATGTTATNIVAEW